jgi:hypothetical protein
MIDAGFLTSHSSLYRLKDITISLLSYPISRLMRPNNPSMHELGCVKLKYNLRIN